MHCIVSHSIFLSLFWLESANPVLNIYLSWSISLTVMQHWVEMYLNYDEKQKQRNGDANEDGSRVTDDDHRGHERSKRDQKVLRELRNVRVDDVNVFRKPVHNSSQRSRFEEQHRTAHDMWQKNSVKVSWRNHAAKRYCKRQYKHRGSWNSSFTVISYALVHNYTKTPTQPFYGHYTVLVSIVN